jgi:transcriptional regulator with PAS, ATPase and Fis domain
MTVMHEAQIESGALLRAMLEGFEGFCYVCAPDYRISFMNAQCRKRVGRDAIGEICYQAIHQRDRPCLFCVLNQVQRGETIRFEMINPADRRWYRSVNIPIQCKEGAVCLLAMVTDINDRKRAEVVLRAAEFEMRMENIFMQQGTTQRCRFGTIFGQSAPMQRVYEQILSAAATDATVIIYGEPGTGKELVAHAIHDMSERRARRFVPVHCGAIPENLVESEFFGHTKGAFSGADTDKAGYVVFADGGTLFLDEVGEIPLLMQIKLLRLIEGLGFTPVGSSQVQQSNIRIIAATNRDLRERIGKGLLREDFYYRIHILPIHLPPLRERKDDLPMLIAHFLDLYGDKQKVAPMTRKLLERLKNYDWPGNVRELQNVIIRYCALQIIELGGNAAPSRTLLAGTPTIRYRGDEEKDLSAMVAAFEKQVIAEALEQHRWKRAKVAAHLGMDRKTLFSKMKRYGLG